MKYLPIIITLFAIACGSPKSLPPEPTAPESATRQVSQALLTPVWTETVVHTSGVRVYGKSVGDVDGDGSPDLLVQHNTSGGLVVLFGPTLTTSVTVDASSTFGEDLEVGDINGDMLPDIVSARPDGLHWYPQGAGGTWGAAQLIDSGTYHDVELGDVDGDLTVDVVVRNQTAFSATESPVHIFANDGSWTETELVNSGGSALLLRDVDADGDLDIIINQQWHENGAGWIAHTWSSTWTYPHSYLDLFDVNGDGRQDILAAPAEPQGGSYRISWLAAPADRTLEWTENVLVASIESTVHFIGGADFNRDGRGDIAYAEMTQSQNDEVVVMLQGASGWTKQLLSVEASHSMRIADFNGDSWPDLAGANWNPFIGGDGDDVKVWWNNPPVIALDQWQRVVIEPSQPNSPLAALTADLDGDGYEDAIVQNDWFKNPGTVSAVWASNDFGGLLNNAIAAWDIDGDGDNDVLHSEGTGNPANNNAFSWGRNNGTGTFTRFSVGTGATGGDFVQGVARVGSSVAISWHAGGQPVQLLTPGADPTQPWTFTDISTASEDEALSPGDIDGDGDTDLFQGTGWLRNDGSTWQRIESAVLPCTPDRNALADIDGDGDLDAAVGCEEDASALYWLERPGNPEALWTVNTIAVAVGGTYSLAVRDFDYDGDPDVVLGEHLGAQRVLLFQNLGAGASWTQHVADPGTLDHHVGTWPFDADRDGDLDVLTIGFSDDEIWISENLAIVEGGGGTGSGGTSGTGGSGATSSAGGSGGTGATSGAGGTGGSPGGGVVPQNGLVAHWALDDGAGTVAADETGTYPGTVSGATWTTGQVGGALDFNGDSSGDWVDLGDWSVPGSALTVSAWMRPRSFDSSSWDNRVFQYGWDTSSSNICSMLSGIEEDDELRLRGRLRTNGSTATLIAEASGQIQLDVWQHVALTYDGITFEIWLDGNSVGSQSKSGVLDESCTGVAIGRTPSGSKSFDGALDQVLVYNRALTPAELADLAAGTPPVNQAPLVSAGPDQPAITGVSLPLSGSVSDDGLPAGGSLTAAWSIVSGPGGVVFGDPSQASTTATFAAAGGYQLRLTGDDSELVSTDDVAITVTDPPNQLPVGAFACGVVTVPLDAAASVDPDGIIISWEWDCGNSTQATGEQASCVYTSSGSYLVTLTVTDDEGGQHIVQDGVELPAVP